MEREFEYGERQRGGGSRKVFGGAFEPRLSGSFKAATGWLRLRVALFMSAEKKGEGGRHARWSLSGRNPGCWLAPASSSQGCSAILFLDVSTITPLPSPVLNFLPCVA